MVIFEEHMVALQKCTNICQLIKAFLSFSKPFYVSQEQIHVLQDPLTILQDRTKYFCR